MSRSRRCKACGATYIPTRPLQVACALACALLMAKNKREKAEKAQKAQLAAETRRVRAETRVRREKLKTRSDWIREAQTAFNRWIRWRDQGRPCISCGREMCKKINAGHFLSVGARPDLRFDEANCHTQDEYCNTYLSGNQANYRAGLIKRIGLAEVERLEGPPTIKKWSIDELKVIKAKYIERLKNERNRSTT